jgi:hypothetical protein
VIVASIKPCERFWREVFGRKKMERKGLGSFRFASAPLKLKEDRVLLEADLGLTNCCRIGSLY